MDKRRNHYVPAGLIRGFCLDGSRCLFLFDVLKKNIYPTTPKECFLINDLHTVIKEGGRKDHSTIENKIMQLETLGIPAIRNFCASASLASEDRRKISDFWALQIVRTPIFRAGVGELIKQQIRSLAKRMDAEGRLPPLPAELNEWGNSIPDLLENGSLEINITMPQITMMGFSIIPELSRLLYKMKWCIIRSYSSHYFILSDHPCSLFVPGNMNIGMGHPEAEICLPVDMHTCLLATRKSVPEIRKAGPKLVTEINHRTALFGDRFFAYPVQSKHILHMLIDYSGNNPSLQDKPCFKNSGSIYNDSSTFVSNRFSSQRHRRLYASFKPIFAI